MMPLKLRGHSCQLCEKQAEAPQAAIAQTTATNEPERGRKGEEAARTWYPGMDLTASTTARDIRCWTNGILCPRLDLSGMETSRVERAHPAGLSHAFLPRPGRQAPLGNRPLCHENRLGSASCHETCLRTQSHAAKTRPTRTGLG